MSDFGEGQPVNLSRQAEIDVIGRKINPDYLLNNKYWRSWLKCSLEKMPSLKGDRDRRREAVKIFKEVHFQGLPQPIEAAVCLSNLNDWEAKKEVHTDNFLTNAKRYLQEKLSVRKSEPFQQQSELNHRQKRMLDKELTEQGNSNLPTVGVEIEVPDYLKTDQARDALLCLFNIQGARDCYAKWEFSTPASSSALAQALLVHELFRGDYLSLEEAGERKQVPKNAVLRMHLNFSIPPDIIQPTGPGLVEGIYYKNMDGIEDHACLLAETVSIGFSSQRRLERPNYRYAYSFGSKVGKVVKPDHENGDEDIARFEIRSLDIHNEQVYRLLVESQKLTACFYDYIRNTYGQLKDTSAIKRAELWQAYYQEATDIFSGYGIDKARKVPILGSIIDKNQGEREKVLRLIKEGELQPQLRSLISKYSQQASRIEES